MATNVQIYNNLFKIISKSAEYLKIDAKAKRDGVWIFMVISCNLFIASALWLMLYSIIFHDLPGKNYAEVIKNMIMTTVAAMTIAKYNILICYKDDIYELIDMMDEDILLSETYPPDEKNVVTTYITKKVRVSQLWTVSVIIACALFPTKSFSQMFYYAITDDFKLVPIFDFTYPRVLNDVKEEPLYFTMFQIIDMTFDIFSMFVSLAFDALAPIFLLHCCGELELLRLRITKTFTVDSDPHKVSEELNKINCKLQNIHRFVSSCQRIFVILYEFLMKITILFISFSGYQVMQSLSRGEANEFTFFFFGSFLQFSLPCYYSDLLMTTGEMFRESIYSCGWEMRSDIKIRKTILFMLTRTVSPIVLRTLFVPLSLDTFAETCRQSYAIYNILMALE